MSNQSAPEDGEGEFETILAPKSTLGYRLILDLNRGKRFVQSEKIKKRLIKEKKRKIASRYIRDAAKETVKCNMEKKNET